MDAPRCTGVAEVVLHDRDTITLSQHAVSATVPFSRWYGPAPVSLAKRVHLVLHMCTTRYSTSSMTVVQDDDYAAGLYRDQGGTPGGRARPTITSQAQPAALPGCRRTII